MSNTLIEHTLTADWVYHKTTVLYAQTLLENILWQNVIDACENTFDVARETYAKHIKVYSVNLVTTFKTCEYNM